MPFTRFDSTKEETAKQLLTPRYAPGTILFEFFERDFAYQFIVVRYVDLCLNEVVYSDGQQDRKLLEDYTVFAAAVDLPKTTKKVFHFNKKFLRPSSTDWRQ